MLKSNHESMGKGFANYRRVPSGFSGRIIVLLFVSVILLGLLVLPILAANDPVSTVRPAPTPTPAITYVQLNEGDGVYILGNAPPCLVLRDFGDAWLVTCEEGGAPDG